MTTKNVKNAVAEKLDKLGFSFMAKHLNQLTERKRKLAIAYEHYRFVRAEKVQAFNEKLKKEAIVGGNYTGSWKTLSFTRIQDYSSVPPDHVLDALAAAQDRKCFDAFEIASIVDVKDPILFGRIQDCTDRFYIDQWDTDVRIEDILMPNEG